MLFRLTFLLSLIGSILYGQSPTVQWQKNLGGSLDDYNLKVSQNNLGEIYVTGTSLSVDQDMAGNHGGSDVFIARINTSNGSVIWKKVYGGTANDEVIGVQAVSGGGAVVLIKSLSTNGNFAQTGLWFVKFNSEGTETAKVGYGGDPSGSGNIIQTSDGGFLIASNKTVAAKGLDLWILKTSAAGVITWEQTVGGTADEVAADAEQMAGAYFILGHTSSASVNSVVNNGGKDLILCKLNENGVVQTTGLFGGGSDEIAGALTVGSGLGGPELFVAATTFSANSGAFNILKGVSDVWLFAVDENLFTSLSANNLIGGNNAEYAADVFFNAANDEPWVIGTTYTPGGEGSGIPAVPNIIAYRTALGDAIGQVVLGGSKEDSATSALQTLDNGVLIAGSSNSSNGNLTGNKGGKDFWIVKLGSCPDELVIDNQVFTGALSRTANKFIRISRSTFEGSETRVKLRSPYILIEPGSGNTLGIEIKPGTVFETETGGCP